MTPNARAIPAALTTLAVLWLAFAIVVRALTPQTAPEAPERYITFANAVDSGARATASSISGELDAKALDEMLRGQKGRMQSWAAPPHLVVLGSVMEYYAGERADYPATSEVLTDAEVEALVADLTAGLGLLTGGAFERFSAITREPLSAGALTRVTRPNGIVVGRYRGVQNQLKTIGLGGRASQPDGTITAAAILLDAEFDRTSATRRLLRMHELGHALGYNHVQSRVSIMNPHIGPEPTEFDRRAALVAFRK